MKLVNIMTTSTDAHITVRKIIVDLRIDDRRLKSSMDCWRHYFANIMFDFSRFDRLAVHRRLQTFEVTVQILKDGSLPGVEHLDTMVANLMTELEIVGKALMPSGVPIQTHLAPGWPLDRGVKCFKFTVNKA
jgi:hypothetical protein